MRILVQTTEPGEEAPHATRVIAVALAVVRNPIFSCMLLTATGLVVLLPNVLSVAALACLFAAVELQVRFVEEPYLLHTHG